MDAVAKGGAMHATGDPCQNTIQALIPVSRVMSWIAELAHALQHVLQNMVFRAKGATCSMQHWPFSINAGYANASSTALEWPAYIPLDHVNVSVFILLELR